MIRKSLLRISLTALVLITAASSMVNGQYSLTYYHMYGIPQANLLNPAFQPECNFYIAMPFLGTTRVAVESNSLQYKDIFTYNSGLGKYVNFLHPEADKEAFMAATKPINNLRMAAGASEISLGFKKNNMFFSVNLAERLENNISVPQDFFEFFVYGAKNQDRFNLSDFSEDFIYFRELAMGMSYRIDEKMQVGGRFKLLFGIANASVESSVFNLTTSIDEWSFQSQVNANLSIPHLELYANSEGELDSLQMPDDFGSQLISDLGFLLGTRNLGFAADMGLQYKPIDKLAVSASLTDIGFIRWKNEATTLKQSGEFKFEGLEIDLTGLSSEDGGSAIDSDELLDSISNQMEFFVTDGPYSSSLAGALHLGAAYELTEWMRVGLATRHRVYKSKFYNQFTLSANVQPIRSFAATLSYSAIGSSYGNLGLGLSMKAGPMQIFFITDQLPSAYLVPNSLQTVNFWLGLNLVFGCPKKEKGIPDDVPLVE